MKAWFREKVQEIGLLDDLKDHLILEDETSSEGSVQSTLDVSEEN